MKAGREPEAAAHAALDKLLALLRQHGVGAGTLRCRVDRAGVLHVEARLEVELSVNSLTQEVNSEAT